MAEEELYLQTLLSEFNTKIRDMEEKQRLLKERVLLIGQNLVESRDELIKEVSLMKFSIETIKQGQEKIKKAVLRLSEDIEKRARRNELEILEKQLKIFQPLEFARIEDVKRMINK